MSNIYDDSSIKSLKGAERVRKRPAVMLGTDDIKGAFHTFKEIVDNALDEARAGFGDRVKVIYHKDKSITVRDYGRGVPMGWNENEQRYNWDLVFNELYAGGKYEDDDDTYKFSKGLNGLGSASTQYTSEFFHVISYRDNGIFEMHFEKGEPVGELQVRENNTGETGTEIHWKSDSTVFSNTDFKFSMFKEYCESQAHLNGIDFILVNESTGEELVYKGESIETYLANTIGDKLVEILSKTNSDRGIERGKKYVAECEVLLAITEECKRTQLYFHNTGAMTLQTSVHFTASNAAITDFFKSIGKQHDVTILPYDYSDYLSILVSSYSNANATSFANQTKEGVDNIYIYDLIYKTITEILTEAVAKNKPSVVALIENVVAAALARKKAKEIEAQERLIRKTTGSSRKQKADKIVECSEKNPSKRELFIVEGDSACGSCENARDSRFQALLPIKGKIINCLKATLEEILANKEVKDIIRTVGTGIDLGATDISGTFNMDKLQYGKIIFTTDADVDGYQIRVLLYCLFYRLMPQLLKEGKVYIAETPLFEIELAREDSLGRKSRFAYTVDEKDAILKEMQEDGIMIKKIHRSKGLGENTADMLWDTTLNPDTRHLVQLDVDVNNPFVRDITNMLFGKDPTKERKSFVFSSLEGGLIDIMDTLDAINSEEQELYIEEV